jgi:hypothetical protein
VRAHSCRICAVCLIPLLLFGMLAAQDIAPGSAERGQQRSFSIGERLVYTVEWDPPWFFFFFPKMNAGEAELSLSEADYKGKKVYKILFKARSSGTLVRLSGVKIDDEFTCLSDPESLCTFAVTKKIREGKRKKQIDVEYLSETHQLWIRETDESVTPPKLKKDELKDNIPECVQDPFSALYSFRRMPLKTGFVQNFTVGNDDRIKEIKSQVENQETVQSGAGTFLSWRINTAALMGGLFKEGGQFRIWLSADERKLPVRFEAKMHLGRALGTLKSVK